MSTPDAKQARAWLEAQIVELGALRNASTRDPGFKQWRQHTLTLIQRIWVGDTTKSGRFKRIPFTTPGAKADRDEVRLAYERGCGEALSCLRALIDEIDARPPRLSAPGVTRDTSDSPLKLGTPEPDFDVGARHGPPKLTVPRKPGIRPVQEADASHPSEMDLREVRNLPPSALSQHAPQEEIEAPPRRPAEAPKPSADESMKRRMEETVRGYVADPSRRPIGEPPRHPAEPPVGGSEEPGEHEVVRRAMADFLGSSPVFAAMDRMERESEDEPRLSPSALALAALASELADLGVPPTHRGFIRDALNELAKHIDHRDLTWDELREAVAVVMEFRGVARRVLPLLLPFLDEAA